MDENGLMRTTFTDYTASAYLRKVGNGEKNLTFFLIL